MALTTAYLQTTKNLQSIINSLVGAKSPDRFTNKFLEDLGFKSTNDRLYIGVFKALGLIDENGVPTSRYHQFLDQSETAKVLAVGIQEAYDELFALKKDAQNLSIDEIKGKFKTLTQGSKSENIILLMANTFKALCDAADWSDTTQSRMVPAKDSDKTKEKTTSFKEPNAEKSDCIKPLDLNLRYDIHVHLPETTNMDVYDAIFQSLKKHLQ
jgi:hypothetical protein